MIFLFNLSKLMGVIISQAISKTDSLFCIRYTLQIFGLRTHHSSMKRSSTLKRCNWKMRLKVHQACHSLSNNTPKVYFMMGVNFATGLAMICDPCLISDVSNYTFKLELPNHRIEEFKAI